MWSTIGSCPTRSGDTAHAQTLRIFFRPAPVRDRKRPARSSGAPHCGMLTACAAHLRAQLAEYARIAPGIMLSARCTPERDRPQTGRNSASRRSRPRLARRRCGRSKGELNPARESEQQLLRRLRPAAPIGRWPNTSSHFWSSRRRRPAQMVAEAHESWIGSHGSVRQGLRGQAGSFWGSPGWLAGSARADSTNFFMWPLVGLGLIENSLSGDQGPCHSLLP